MIKAIVFDLDNTLIDFLRLKRISCEAAIDAMIDAGLKVDKKKAMKDLFKLYGEHGLEDPKIFQRFLNKTLGRVDYRILANGIVAYRKVRSGFLEAYPHTSYVLLKLRAKGKKLAIVTDAPKIKAWIRLATMKIADFFDVVVAYEDTGKLKPHKLPFKSALAKLKLKAEECLMVGDWPERDIEGAKRLGMKTCFARYGAIKKVKKIDVDYIIDDIKELLQIIE